MATRKTTANEPIAAIDPGGTHPTKAGSAKKPAVAASKQKVKTADRNMMPRKK